MLKILTIFGTRPEVIKLAPFMREVDKDESCKGIICATTQHRELQNDVLTLFNIKADYNLDIMKDNQDLFHISEQGLNKIKSILDKEKPDWVVVQGDTTTAFIAALAAFYQQTSVIHIEAGLRTKNPYSPFPEEMNRSLIGKIAKLHMAPTLEAVNNLAQEGIHKGVFHVGNTIVDSVVLGSTLAAKQGELLLGVLKNFAHQQVILITVHRRENFGQPLIDICKAILKLANHHPEKCFIWPVHPNPNVRKVIYEYLSNCKNIILLEPLTYNIFLQILNKCTLIMTDSGGMQEEASILGKSVVILREMTERPEVVECGLGHIVGSSVKKIVEVTEKLFKNYHNLGVKKYSLYGNPGVSKEILTIIKNSSK